MTVVLNPYLPFRGEAREAFDFYHSVFGGELTALRFGDMGIGDASEADKLMHTQLLTETGLRLMGADVPNDMPLDRGTPQVSLSGDEEAQLRAWWDGLAEGATILEPLTPSPWGDTFGMLTDRFGVLWMVNIAGTGQPADA